MATTNSPPWDHKADGDRFAKLERIQAQAAFSYLLGALALKPGLTEREIAVMSTDQQLVQFALAYGEGVQP